MRPRRPRRFSRAAPASALRGALVLVLAALVAWPERNRLLLDSAWVDGSAETCDAEMRSYVERTYGRPEDGVAFEILGVEGSADWEAFVRVQIRDASVAVILPEEWRETRSETNPAPALDVDEGDGSSAATSPNRFCDTAR